MPVPTQYHPNSSLSPRTAAASTTSTRLKDFSSVRSEPSNTSYAPTVVPNGQPTKLNIVTRLALEGKAKQDKDGASIKMYLKISVPRDTIQPGSTVPLFPEENIKILTSHVHPLDSHSVPFNFSSTVSPLLHKAARALNLPARSTETFSSAFLLSPTLVGSSSTSASVNASPLTGTENIPPVDSHYAGHILVSGYHISYVLPKVFPTRPTGHSDTESEEYSRPSHRHRRRPVSDGGSAQFMAAIDMWIPYNSRPPRSPYLLSIPLPRCLHNNIRLRIFPPITSSASFASLSSIEDDGTSWELTSDPHVTRTTSSRPSRSNSYSHFADDESSSSSTVGFSDGCGIRGTFPSAERIRIRWAKPMKSIDVPGEPSGGRKRVGVKDVKGEMTCIIRGKTKPQELDGSEGLLMGVEYKGTCRGVWFPGVATLLGMDISLDAKGSDVFWADGSPNTWDISGGVGYTGFDVGGGSEQTGHQAHANLTSSMLLPDALLTPSLGSHSSSSTSLLRAPLPGRNIPDFSFEGSARTASSSPLDLSSLSSLTPASDSMRAQSRPPGIPFTLHINMNELIAPAKNVFTFTVSGTVVVVARPTASRSNAQLERNRSPAELRSEDDPRPIVLPRFTILAADSENTSTVVRNEVDNMDATVEVYNSTGDIYRDAQAKKTVLQRGSSTKCSDTGGRIALRSISAPYHGVSGNGHVTPLSSRARIPNSNEKTGPSIGLTPLAGRLTYLPRPKRDGPLTIPSVVAYVMPLLHAGDFFPNRYAVRLCLNTPGDTDSDWLEFGLAQPSQNGPVATKQNPTVAVINTTVEGVTVKHEIMTAAKPGDGALEVNIEQIRGKEWVAWIKVRVGASSGSTLMIDYLVENDKEKERDVPPTKHQASLDILLPSLSLPIGRLEVNVDESSTNILSLTSNFPHQQSTVSGKRLLNYSVKQFFHPQLLITIRSPTRLMVTGRSVLVAISTLIIACSIIVYVSHKNLQPSEDTFYHQGNMIGGEWSQNRLTQASVTVTETVYVDTCTKSLTSTPVLSTAPMISVATTLPESTPTNSLPSLDSKTDEEASSTSLSELYPLAYPIQQILNFSWSMEDVHFTVDKIMQSLDKVWYMLRKMYHYPLDPT